MVKKNKLKFKGVPKFYGRHEDSFSGANLNLGGNVNFKGRSLDPQRQYAWSRKVCKVYNIMYKLL